MDTSTNPDALSTTDHQSWRDVGTNFRRLLDDAFGSL
jgi:hypothetical protein